MSVVVDASLATAWIAQEVHTNRARGMLAQWQSDQTDLLSATIVVPEVGSTLLRKVKRGEMAEVDLVPAFNAVMAAITVVPDLPGHGLETLLLAISLGQSKVYDSMYAVVAKSYGCELWTADERYADAAAALYPWVKFVGR